MLSSYRTLLGRPGARELLAVCAVSWLSFSGYGLAVILAVHAATKSYATAGAAVAVQSVGAGMLAPVRGRLVDRHGATALCAVGLCHALAGAVLTLALVLRLTAADFVGGALLGATSPPLIGVARARWTAVAGADLARVGHALNAALSDGAQIATPAAVAVIALVASPLLPIPLLVGGAASAAFYLAAQLPRQRHGPEKIPATRAGLLGILRESAGLRALAACELATAGWLAGLEIAVIALSGRHGPPEIGAFTLVAAAAGSIIVSLLAGGSRIAGAPVTRYRLGAVLAAATMPLILLTTRLPALAAILLIVGAAFGLINVAFYELLDDLSPPGRSTETFTWVTTASSIGGAIGASVSGHLTTTSANAPPLFIVALAVTAALIAMTRFKEVGRPGG
jgi:hypothetical protein